MERERLAEACIGKSASVGLGEGVSVNGTPEAVDDRGVVVHVDPAYRAHEPAMYMFYLWTHMMAIEHVEKE